MNVAPLGELVGVRSSLEDPKKPQNAHLPHVSPEHIEGGSGKINWSKVRSCEEDGVISGKYAFQPGDIIYSKIRPYLNKIAVADRIGMCSADMYALVVNEDLASRSYLTHWMASDQFLGYAASVSGRANIPKINRTQLLKAPIPLPPLEEQRWIAGILDAADALRRRRRETLTLLDTLPGAIFAEMFGSPYSPKVETSKLSDLAVLDMGQSPPGSSYNEQGIGVPLLNGPAEFTHEHPIAVQWTDRPTKICEAEDLLFCVRGATAGRTNISDKSYCLGRGLAAIRSKNGDLDIQEFLNVTIPLMYSYFQSKGVGSTFINISKTELANTPVPKPTKENARLIASISRKTIEMRTCTKKHLTELETLFASLQSRAFAGEL